MSAQELSNGTRSELKQWDQVIVQGQTTSEFRVRVQTLGPGRMESGVGVERTTTAYSLTACSSIATVTTVVNIKHWILNEILLHTMNNCYRHHPWVMRCTLPCSSAAERPSCTCLVSNSPHSTAAVWRTVWRHLGPSPCTTRQSSQSVRLTVICLTINNSDVETIFIFTLRHPSSKSGLMYRQLQQRTGCTTNMYKTGIQRTGARVETVNGWWLLQKILFWQTFLSPRKQCQTSRDATWLRLNETFTIRLEDVWLHASAASGRNVCCCNQALCSSVVSFTYCRFAANNSCHHIKILTGSKYGKWSFTYSKWLLQSVMRRTFHPPL